MTVNWVPITHLMETPARSLPEEVLYTVISHTSAEAPALEQVAQPFALDPALQGLLWIHGHHSSDSDGEALLAAYLLARSAGFLL
jgi:hypothetical protein